MAESKLDLQLKAAIQDAQVKFPGLTDWQKALYANEVVPQYQRFIRDYRPAATGLSVEIDFDSLKHYLSFYAPKTLRQQSPRVLLWANPEATCARCVESSAEILKLVQARVENRGFTPVWLKTQEIEAEGVAGTALTDENR